jgi:hypothetical protein
LVVEALYIIDRSHKVCFGIKWQHTPVLLMGVPVRFILRETHAAAGTQVDGQAIVVQIEQSGCDGIELTPVRAILVAQDDEGPVAGGEIEVAAHLNAVRGIKINCFLGFGCTDCAANQEAE